MKNGARHKPHTIRQPERFLLHKETTKRHHHRSFEAAAIEAARLLAGMPDETIIITQVVGRVTLKAINPDAVTGCSDDQTFAIGGVPQ